MNQFEAMDSALSATYAALERKPEPEILDLEKRAVANNNHDDTPDRGGEDKT